MQNRVMWRLLILLLLWVVAFYPFLVSLFQPGLAILTIPTGCWCPWFPFALFGLTLQRNFSSFPSFPRRLEFRHTAI